MFALIVLAALLIPATAEGKTERTTGQVVAPTTVMAGEDLHLTNATQAIAAGATVSLDHADSWLFFDNVRPSDVVSQYADRILINGEPLHPGTNGRVAIYRQGTAVIPHAADYAALTASDGKQTVTFSCDHYYTNAPGIHVPEGAVRPLPLDNAITHIRLARGYMATLACESDGMGYSRVFVADDDDIDIDLPSQLAGKVSFIRAFRWQYPSKKGWVGSTWTAMPDGLKYAFQQADLTRSTWYYNWGSSPTTDLLNADATNYNQEYVPEKWGAGGLWDGVYKVQEATHLMGYNEPDYLDDLKASLEKNGAALESTDQEVIDKAVKMLRRDITIFKIMVTGIDSITLDRLNSNGVEVKVYDLNGRRVNSAAQGIYIVRITADGVTTTHKVAVK